MTDRNQYSGTKHRLKILERADSDDLPPFRLTDRDKEIVRAVYTHRALTTPQVHMLFFPSSGGVKKASSATRCQHRLKLLFHYGFLYRDAQPQRITEGRKPLVYFLDEKGEKLLADELGVERSEIDWHPRDNDVGDPFMEHLLATNDVRVAIEVAAERNGWVIEKWVNERDLKSKQMKDYVEITGPRGGKSRAAVVPDGYFQLGVGERIGHFFLEVDRRTVTGQASKWERRDWARKIRAFLAYYRSGMYHERYGTKSLRILTVTTGDRRLSNLKRITEEVGGKARFWFSTFDRITPEDVLTTPIWDVASRDGNHAVV